MQIPIRVTGVSISSRSRPDHGSSSTHINDGPSQPRHPPLGYYWPTLLKEMLKSYRWDIGTLNTYRLGPEMQEITKKNPWNARGSIFAARPANAILMLLRGCAAANSHACNMPSSQSYRRLSGTFGSSCTVPDLGSRFEIRRRKMQRSSKLEPAIPPNSCSAALGSANL